MWVESVGYADCVPMFREHRINGRALLMLKEDDMREVIHHNVGQRKNLYHLVRMLQVRFNRHMSKVESDQQQTSASSDSSSGSGSDSEDETSEVETEEDKNNNDATKDEIEKDLNINVDTNERKLANTLITNGLVNNKASRLINNNETFSDSYGEKDHSHGETSEYAMTQQHLMGESKREHDDEEELPSSTTRHHQHRMNTSKNRRHHNHNSDKKVAAAFIHATGR